MPMMNASLAGDITKVSELIMKNPNKWDEEKLHQIFTPIEASKIKEI